VNAEEKLAGIEVSEVKTIVHQMHLCALVETAEVFVLIQLEYD